MNIEDLPPAAAIAAAMQTQRNLDPAFKGAMGRIAHWSPTDANLVWSFVTALRQECAGRRIENREIRSSAGAA